MRTRILAYCVLSVIGASVALSVLASQQLRDTRYSPGHTTDVCDDASPAASPCRAHGGHVGCGQTESVPAPARQIVDAKQFLPDFIADAGPTGPAIPAVPQPGIRGVDGDAKAENPFQDAFADEAPANNAPVALPGSDDPLEVAGKVVLKTKAELKQAVEAMSKEGADLKASLVKLQSRLTQVEAARKHLEAVLQALEAVTPPAAPNADKALPEY